LPSSKFWFQALFGLYCVESCYLHRSSETGSEEKLRKTYTASADGFFYAFVGGLVSQRHDQIDIAQI